MCKRFMIFLTVATSIALLSACGASQTSQKNDTPIQTTTPQPTKTLTPIQTTTPQPAKALTPEQGSEHDTVSAPTPTTAPEDTNPYGYDMHEYTDGEDLYYDNEDDFEDEEEAEDYYDDYGQ